MKKILYIAAGIVAFVLGVMIWFYIAEPVGKAASKDLPAVPAITAKQAILIDGKSGEILFEKAGAEQAYPASTTKIMSALVASIFLIFINGTTPILRDRSGTQQAEQPLGLAEKLAENLWLMLPPFRDQGLQGKGQQTTITC